MHTRAFNFEENQLVITYDTTKSPLNIALTAKSSPAFGAMAYAAPGKGTPVTILRDHESFNEGSKELAVSLVQKFGRPAFVNTSVGLGMGLSRRVVEAVDECLAGEQEQEQGKEQEA